ncbi:MAG: polysaccharide deacetylase family protein [Bacteroidales bacterium]|nr:polysaccharide deacetylase family protein [Bacteroidales bacterium]MCB9013761.1 polysaccharide deacetylase family protein [Bacteroidales bacterium]
MKYFKQILFLSIIVAVLSSCSKEKIYLVNEVVLSFDDAPNFPENVVQILDILDKHHVKATFFCIGEALRAYPEIAERISVEQVMGNHTYSHINILKNNLSEIFDKEILQTQEIIDSLQPSNPHYFRPPFGKIGSDQRRFLIQKGYTIIMWDLSAEEWNDKVTTRQVLNYYHTSLQSKAKIPVILFHLNTSSVEALDILLGEFEEEGISVISLEEYLSKI